MTDLHPYAGQREDRLIGDDRKPTVVEVQLERAEEEISRLRETVRRLEGVLKTAASVLAPYAKKAAP